MFISGFFNIQPNLKKQSNIQIKVYQYVNPSLNLNSLATVDSESDPTKTVAMLMGLIMNGVKVKANSQKPDMRYRFSVDYKHITQVFVPNSNLHFSKVQIANSSIEFKDVGDFEITVFIDGIAS